MGSGEHLWSHSSCVLDLTHDVVDVDVVLENSAKKREISVPLWDCENMVCWGKACVRFSSSSAKMGF